MSWSESGIAWKSDVEKKFAARNLLANEVIPMGLNKTVFGPNGLDGNHPQFNEHFIVWMRTAGLPTFKKLYAKIDADLPKGTYTIEVADNFRVERFSGTKAIVLSTVSWLGGKNTFLGGAYLAVGILCLILAGGFLIKHKVSPRSVLQPVLSRSQPV